MNTFDKEKARQKAIENLGGMESLYCKYLARFKDSYGNATVDIAAAMNNGDTEEARRLAHSIKGLAATLGLIPLSEQAAMLEDLFHQAMIAGFTAELSAQILPALDSFEAELIAACA